MLAEGISCAAPVQLELAFDPEVVRRWSVTAGRLKIEVALLRRGAEARLVSLAEEVGPGVGTPYEHWYASLLIRPPVRARLKLESAFGRARTEDIPVPGPGVDRDWLASPLLARPLAEAMHVGGGDMPRGGAAAIRGALQAMAHHLEGLWDTAGLEAAGRFPLALGARWWIYASTVNDPTGRVAQMARSCGGLLLCMALDARRAGALASDLLRGGGEGARLNRLLDRAQAAWAEANRRHPVRPRHVGEVEFAAQRLRIRRACPSVPPSLLFNGVPGRLAPEDVPAGEQDRLEWFRATSGAGMARARERLSVAQLDGLARFLSFNWRWVRAKRRELGRGWPAYLDHLVDYLIVSGRRLCRRNAPARLEARVRQWGQQLSWRRTPHLSETVLPLHGLQPWQGARGTFAPLRTVGDLVEESARMNHCVAAFADWALSGRVIFAHGDIDGAPVTVSLRVDMAAGRYCLMEAAGAHNRPLDPEEMAAVRQWLAAISPPAQGG